MSVYATQMHLTRTKDGLRPKFATLLPEHPVHQELVRKYGPLIWLLGSDDGPWTPGVMDKLRNGLKDFDGSKDYLLCLGNPVLMSMMSVLAADYADQLRFLQWRQFYRDEDGARQRYESEGEYQPLTFEL